MAENSDKIKTLWLNPNLSASFSGLATFKTALFLEKGINISNRKLSKILSTISDYVTQIQLRSKIERRKMVCHGYFSVVQRDLMMVKKFRHFCEALIVIDIYTLKVW